MRYQYNSDTAVIYLWVMNSFVIGEWEQVCWYLISCGATGCAEAPSGTLRYCQYRSWWSKNLGVATSGEERFWCSKHFNCWCVTPSCGFPLSHATIAGRCHLRAPHAAGGRIPAMVLRRAETQGTRAIKIWRSGICADNLIGILVF